GRPGKPRSEQGQAGSGRPVRCSRVGCSRGFGPAAAAAMPRSERWPPPARRRTLGDRIRLTGRLLHLPPRYPRGVRRCVPVRIVLAFAASACSAAGSPDRFVPVDGRLPSIAGTTLDGTPITPAATQGKVVLVNFWNPDCPPCRDEMSVLQAAWDRYRT